MNALFDLMVKEELFYLPADRIQPVSFIQKMAQWGGLVQRSLSFYLLGIHPIHSVIGMAKKLSLDSKSCSF